MIELWTTTPAGMICKQKDSVHTAAMFVLGEHPSHPGIFFVVPVPEPYDHVRVGCGLWLDKRFLAVNEYYVATFESFQKVMEVYRQLNKNIPSLDDGKVNIDTLPFSLELYQMASIDKADALAEEQHRMQRRKDGSPYIEHPRAVSRIAGEWANQIKGLCEGNEDYVSIRIIGLLHDIIEDCNVTMEQIESMFGETIASCVDNLSNRKEIKDAKERLKEYCNRLQSDDTWTTITKLADLYHNASSRTSNLPWAEKWHGKALEMFNNLPWFAHQWSQSKLVLEEIHKFLERAKEAHEKDPNNLPA